MPIEFVGGLFPRNQLAPCSAYAKPLDLKYLRDLAQAHEHAGFDRVLIANGGGDPLFLAAYAAAHTEKLGFMLAHRPGLTAPTIAARAFATMNFCLMHWIMAAGLSAHCVKKLQNANYIMSAWKNKKNFRRRKRVMRWGSNFLIKDWSFHPTLTLPLASGKIFYFLFKKKQMGVGLWAFGVMRFCSQNMFIAE